MPTKCSVKGCTGFSTGKSFFYLPAILKYKYSGEKIELSMKRRKRWLEALDIKDEPDQQIKVCSEHFLTGRPAALDDPTNIDWVPTLRMKFSKFPVSRKRKRSSEENRTQTKTHNFSFVAKDNIKSSSRRKIDLKKHLNYKVLLDGTLHCTNFNGTNGSGLALWQKYGKFTSDNVTLKETAINNTILRVHLIKENLKVLRRRYSILAQDRRKRKEAPVSSFGRQIKKKKFSLDYECDDGPISRPFNVIRQMPSDVHSRAMQIKNNLLLNINSEMKNQGSKEVGKPSVHSKIQSKQVLVRPSVENSKTLNKVIKRNDKDRIRVKFFPKMSIPVKTNVKNGTINKMQPDEPLKLHREILFVKQYRNELLWENSDTSYYLKFPFHRPHDDGKLKYPFQKLVTDVKYMKLPAPSWKIKVIIRQGKIAAITFTNKLLLERCISFSANSDRYTIVIDNRPALLLGSPGCVFCARDLEVLLDIVQNIDANNSMIFYK